MQEPTTHHPHPSEQETPQRSSSSKLPLFILILVIIGGLYWYQTLPQAATFENPAIATFNASHNFEAPDLKAFGDGVVVIAPHFTRSGDAGTVDLGVTVWAKQPGKVLEIREIEIENLTLPFQGVAQISPADVANGLFRSDVTLKTQIPVEELLAAARKSGGKLKLTLKGNAIENVPQRRVHPLDISYLFDVASRRVTPWSK